MERVKLLKPSSSAAALPVDADILDEIPDQAIADFEASWIKARLATVDYLMRQHVHMVDWPQSLHWDWRFKREKLEKNTSAAGVTLMCGGETQALMVVDWEAKKSKLAEGLPVLYVEYLEAAPWNWPKWFTGRNPLFKGVGRAMILRAVQLSFEGKCEGRIALLSLPTAESFYSDTCGMTNLGPDASESNLPYFEMSSEQAAAYLKGR